MDGGEAGLAAPWTLVCSLARGVEESLTQARQAVPADPGHRPLRPSTLHRAAGWATLRGVALCFALQEH